MFLFNFLVLLDFLGRISKILFPKPKIKLKEKKMLSNRYYIILYTQVLIIDLESFKSETRIIFLNIVSMPMNNTQEIY